MTVVSRGPHFHSHSIIDFLFPGDGGGGLSSGDQRSEGGVDGRGTEPFVGLVARVNGVFVWIQTASELRSDSEGHQSTMSSQGPEG